MRAFLKDLLYWSPVIAACALLALPGCTTNKPQEFNGPVRYECDMKTVRIIPTPDAPPTQPFSIPINPCGFKV